MTWVACLGYIDGITLVHSLSIGTEVVSYRGLTQHRCVVGCGIVWAVPLALGQALVRRETMTRLVYCYWNKGRFALKAGYPIARVRYVV
jgi:hypothetical protein